MSNLVKRWLLVSAGAAMLALGVALPAVATYSYAYPSYQGCQIQQYALATISGGTDLMYAESQDTASCATRVAAKLGRYICYGGSCQYYYWGWSIGDPNASVLKNDLDFSYGQGWAQIETGTDDWGVDPGGYGAVSIIGPLVP